MTPSMMFYGKAELNKPLTPELSNWLYAFSLTRHFKRDVSLLKDAISKTEFPTILTNGVPPIKLYKRKKDLGADGKFFAISVDAEKVIENDELYENTYCKNYDTPAGDSPGLWCNWKPTNDNTGIHCDNVESSVTDIEWLKWLIKYIFEPDDYILNGRITYQGEERDDRGVIIIKDNKVSVLPDLISNRDNSNDAVTNAIISLTDESFKITDDIVERIKSYIVTTCMVSSETT